MYHSIMLIAKDFLIPLGLIFWQWRGKYRDKYYPYLMTILVGAYVAFIYLTAEWAIYGYYFRYIIATVWLFATIHLFFRIRELPLKVAKNPREKFGQLVIFVFTFVLIIFSGWAFWGHFVSEGSVALSFPLRNGAYYIIEGGNSPMINTYHALPPIPQKFALDIVKLQGFGKRADGLFPDDLTNYAIFDEPVYSPCDGMVIAVIDSLPDIRNKHEGMDEEKSYGNYVIIGKGDCQIKISQLKLGSIPVEKGATVAEGQLIGRVGCSGDVAEPHLHIEATLPATDPRVTRYWDRSGVPILFDHRFLVRNDRIEVGSGKWGSGKWEVGSGK